VLSAHPGVLQRSVSSAAVALATVALTAACTGGSSDGKATPTPTAPHPSTTSATPDTIAEDATTSLHGTATITLGQSSPVTVATTRSEPATIQLSPSGAASIDMAMHGSGNNLFSLSGPAKIGRPVTTAHVTILLASSGVIVDTNAGNPCTATYAVVSEKQVSGTVRCETLSGQQKVPVVVRFTAK
jgi:hypothetical protein